MNSPNSNSPETVETGLAAEPLRALRRGLVRADGFALYIAVVKTPAQRNQLIGLLAEAIPTVKLQTVTLRADSTDILQEIQKQLGGKPSGPLMVVGLEEALPSDARNHPILNALNLRRPDWPQLVPQPVVFWVPEYLLGILARSAPDFLDWRSDTLHFPEVEPGQLQILRSATWNGGLDTRMSVETRLERVKELESRIASNESSSDPAVRFAVSVWLNELGLHFALLGQNRKAFDCFHKVQTIAENLGLKDKQAMAFGNLGNVCEILGDSIKAIEFLERSLRLHREICDRRGEGMDLGNLGFIYANQGELLKSIDFCEKQLTIAREIGDHRGEGGALFNLGRAYADLGHRIEAVKYFEQALAIFRNLGDYRGESGVLGNIGTLFAKLGDTHKALGFYGRALTLSRKIGDRFGEGYALSNIATAFNQLGDRAKALARAEDALKIFDAIEDPYAARVRTTLAEWRKQASPQ